MRASQKVLLPLGTLGLALLVWRLDMSAVRAGLAHLGWGLALVIGQELVAHLLNALGWRFAFAPEDARAFPLVELVRLRVVGDAINYVTPTATLGGEVARVAMLDERRSSDVRTVSVIIAKATQTLAQALFVTAGLVLAVTCWTGLAFARPLARVAGLGMAGVAPVMLGGQSWWAAASAAWRRAFGPGVLAFVRDHPGRVALSASMFALGYAWGAFEAYWICRLLRFPVTVATAFSIEMLSITVDAFLFMVPAKIGTQEGGKVAVFAALGLPATAGFAFGVVRHLRELAWAGIGLLLCVAVPGGERLGQRFARPSGQAGGLPR